MSGANTIAVATVLLETGMFPMKEPTTIMKLDAPAGLVTITADCKAGKAEFIEFRNVPAFVWALDLEVDVPGIDHKVKVDIAYGGMWYVLVDAVSVVLEIESANGAELVNVGERHQPDEQGHITDDNQPLSSLPQHITILDSSPGAWSYQFNVDLLTAAIKLGWQRMMVLPVAHLVAMIFWILIRCCGLPDNQKTYATANNDPRKNHEVSRTYIYGSADKICPAWFVELDAVEAKNKGFKVQLERFEGSGHVAHIRTDPDRYWRIVKKAWDVSCSL